MGKKQCNYLSIATAMVAFVSVARGAAGHSPSYDLEAITNISAMTDMEYASLDGRAAPARMAEPEKPSGEAAKWLECGNDPTWFTNSAGERISVERYCAILNVEGGQEAELSFNSQYQRCGADLTLRLAEFYAEGQCKVCDFNTGDVVDGSDERIVYRAWKVGDELYLLFEENDAGTMKMRNYIVVMFDGETFRRLVQFEFPPSDEQMKNVLLARTNAAALNNIAVMIDRDEAERRAADENYVVRLLEMSALAGEQTACRNLAYYYKRRGAIACSATWAGLAGVVARRRGGATGRLMRRPLTEWPLMFGAGLQDAWQGGDRTGRPAAVGGVDKGSQDCADDRVREAKAKGMLEAWGLSVDLKNVGRECDASDENADQVKANKAILNSFEEGK